MLLLAVALALGCGGDRHHQRAPTARPAHEDFFGTVSDDTFAGRRSYRERTLSSQENAGVRLLRQTFDWATVEREPGRYDLSRYDRYVAQAASHGIHVLPILFDPPAFRSGAPARGARRGTYPPRRSRDLATFASVLVRRYGPRGSLWAERPTLPRLPIRSWQIWNEPNLPVYWPEGPNPAAYVRLLRTAARAIKRLDPGAEIVSAGLSESRLGMPFKEFVTGMYRAGAGDSLDTFALHAFARDARATVGAVESTRELLRELGDRPPIWVTEFGWASAGPASPFTVRERTQAQRIASALRGFFNRRHELGIRGAVYYDWKDAPPFPGGRDFFGLHTGLLRRDGSAKPALGAFRGVARPLR
jgi:polysaccharide biosynthesis protein PslG